MEITSRLQRGASDLGLTLSEEMVSQLELYLGLIQKWNLTYNLVGTSELKDLVHKHILDSLSLSRFVDQTPVIDVGSGAGLPGIPLAISLPDISFTLVDANGKKVRFMRQACIELKLTNVNIVQSRIENLDTNQLFNTVVARAFAPLESALDQLQAVCAPGGHVNIMLGVLPDVLPTNHNFSDIQANSINVPGLNSSRHILVAKKYSS